MVQVQNGDLLPEVSWRLKTLVILQVQYTVSVSIHFWQNWRYVVNLLPATVQYGKDKWQKHH
jgi:hypothetical protein